jgi:hypothetical protein
MFDDKLVNILSPKYYFHRVDVPKNAKAVPSLAASINSMEFSSSTRSFDMFHLKARTCLQNLYTTNCENAFSQYYDISQYFPHHKQKQFLHLL